ncbi:hypothetical protein WKH56_07640 [Priestia sp. SB1]|uniref:hypothetical protein n=1 Tax=Priestia sp. SB1 TaxID=3132359 RepID=UPI003174C9FE
MSDRYEVIKEIPKGWETGAKVKDILTVSKWNGDLTLMKGDKAVCDIGSEYGKDYCKPIE